MATAKKAAKAKPVAENEIKVGSVIKFLGYSEDTAEESKLLDDDGEYKVIEVSKDEDSNPVYIVQLENPEFDKTKKENANTNTRMIETEVFPAECELVTGDAEEAEEVAEEEEAPAPVAKKAATKVAAKAAPAVKGKAAAKAAPVVKGKAAAVKAAKPAKAEKVVAPAVEEMPDLENEDEAVLALIAENDNLIEIAQGLESDIAKNEYLIGGILFHVKKDGAYKDADPSYAEKGGWAKFLSDNMNIEYRKAQYLIDIYVAFNVAGITDAADRVAAMGWTKASKIAPLMNEDGQNPEELITLANESTVAELQESISVQKTSVGAVKGEIKKRTIMKFSFFEDEGAALADIINGAMEQHGLKKHEEAFAMIVNEWAAQNAGGTAVAEEHAPVQTAPVGSAKARIGAPKAAAKPVAKARAKA